MNKSQNWFISAYKLEKIPSQVTVTQGVWALGDGDTLLGILHDRASSEARERYLKKTFEKKSQKKGG